MQDLERRPERAKLHLDDLDVQVKKFGGMRETYPTQRGRQLKRGDYVLHVTGQKPIPPTFGLIAADFVHNLRALLDNLIWAISPASLKGSGTLAFPICTTGEIFDEFCEAVFDGRMPANKVDVLKRHQPYHRRPDDVANDRLCILHKMWIADKHHAPFGVTGWAVAASGAWREDIPRPPFGFRVGELGKNNEVGWVTAEGAKHDIRPRVMLDVGFKTRRPTMAVPRHALFKMYEIVAKEVLPDFRQFL